MCKKSSGYIWALFYIHFKRGLEGSISEHVKYLWGPDYQRSTTKKEKEQSMVIYPWLIRNVSGKLILPPSGVLKEWQATLTLQLIMSYFGKFKHNIFFSYKLSQNEMSHKLTKALLHLNLFF